MNLSDLNPLAGRSVLVTGATGFIGSHLTRRLLDTGCDVWILNRKGSDSWRIADILHKLNIVNGELGTITAEEILEILPSGIRYVFHLAAAGVNQSQAFDALAMQTNIMGTANLLQWARQILPERFLYCGSCFEYGPGESLHEDLLPAPNSDYGASKAAAWMLVQACFRRYRLPVVSLRPFTVFGPFEGTHRLIPYVISKTLQEDSIALTGGIQTRDFIFIEDVIDAFLQAAVCKDAIGQTFNICTGQATQIRSVVNMIVELIGGNAQPQFGLIPYRDDELWVHSGSPSAAHDVLGWKAKHSLRQGLENTIGWFLANEDRSLHAT
ncbi:MAG: NAD-dependent epimerase/dehydratase family protein [Anaerolinea sp.]|nr:NAD-dependent epimerase/dehydratase family protein [Anaerolinea sp.]